MIYICGVGFASLYVVCGKLNDCACNVGLYQLSDKCVLLTCVTCGCSAASNWKPGPHAVSTIVTCLQSPDCC